TVDNCAGHLNQMAANIRWPTIQAAARRSPAKERARRQRLIIMAQEIEAYLGPWPVAKRASDAFIMVQISQHSIPQSPMRKAAQLLLNGLDLLVRVVCARKVQADRKDSGKPAYSAREIQVIKNFFAAMPLQIDQQR